MEVAEAKVKVEAPRLRFSGNKGAWKEHRLDAVCEKIQDGTHFSPPLSDEGPYKYISARNIRNGAMLLHDMQYVDEEHHREIYKRSDVRFGDVLLTKDGASTGNVCLNELDEEFSLLSSVAFIRGDNVSASSEFIYQYLFSPFGQREVQAAIAGQAITRITLEKLRGFKFRFPTLPEQQKIAAFLGAVDRKIQQLKRKQALLEQYKKGVMQQLFSQELRFKREDGSEYPEWVERELGEVLTEHKLTSTGNEEVYSVSVHKSLINQVEHLGRVYAAETTDHYNRVLPGDIVYTKSPTGEFKYGIIKQSRLDKAVIVSPLYGVFTPETRALGYWLDAYFESIVNTYNYLHPIVQKGAKNTIAVTNRTFLSNTLKLPVAHEEQEKIAGFLMALDAKVAGVAQAVAAAQKWKKGLLQQMFV